MRHCAPNGRTLCTDLLLRLDIPQACGLVGVRCGWRNLHKGPRPRASNWTVFDAALLAAVISVSELPPFRLYELTIVRWIEIEKRSPRSKMFDENLSDDP